MSMRAIGRVTGLSKSTICRKIADFATEDKEQDMPRKQALAKDDQARIAELEAKLRKAELARDAPVFGNLISVNFRTIRVARSSHRLGQTSVTS